MSELEFLKNVVKESSKLITSNFTINTKGTDGDRVTNLDFEVEKYIIEKIKHTYPTFDIISEEFNPRKSKNKNYFVIDPIDGTKNFTLNIPLWTIQVCCVKNNKVVASVVYIPPQNEMFYADHTGAYLNGKRITVKKYKNLIDVHFGIEGKDNLKDYFLLKDIFHRRRNYGCAGVSFSYVACGRLHAVMFKYDNIWDYLPGLYIAKQAGAHIINKKGCHLCASTKELAEILFLADKVK